MSFIWWLGGRCKAKLKTIGGRKILAIFADVVLASTDISQSQQRLVGAGCASKRGYSD